MGKATAKPRASQAGIEVEYLDHDGSVQRTTIPIPGNKTISAATFDRLNPIYVAIPEGITEIGQNAFKNHVNLESVVIPKNVTEIDSRAFGNCIKQITA